MKSVTIRDVQHNLAQVLRDVAVGEEVEILRRKIPVARIVPIPASPVPEVGVSWDGHQARMASVWGDKSVANMESVLADLRGER